MMKLIMISIFTIGFAATLNVMSCAHSNKVRHDLGIPVLTLEPVRELNLQAPIEQGRGAFISAASGIIKVGDAFYVVSDDEQYLFSFNLGDLVLKEHRLLTGNLSVVPKIRKSEKADFESLVGLSPEQWPPYGAIVAWPSGSGVKRMRAVVMPFKKNNEFDQPVVSDILPLAYRLQKNISDLNMEGLLVQDKKVFIFQRGNAGKGKNGIIEMPLTSWIDGLKRNEWGGKVEYKKIKIGTLNGVNLTFSDVAWTKFGLLALASAEDSVSSYADGAVYGSVLVRVVGDNAEVLAKFDPIVKLEGLAVVELSDGLELYMVDDADRSDAASRLYRVQLSGSFLSSVKQKGR